MKSPKSGTKISASHIKTFMIAAPLLGAAILFSGCENDLETIKAFTSPKDLPVLYAEEYKSTSIDSGQVRNYLEAPVIQQFESDGGPYVEFPKGVVLNEYDSHNKIISSITADYAKQFTKEKKWEAKNNVIAVNDKGDTLKTEHLIWEEKTGKIYSDRYVKFVRDDKIIHGNGFESDQNMDNWRINEVKGTIYIDLDETNKNAPPENEAAVPRPKEQALKQKKMVHVENPVSIQK